MAFIRQVQPSDFEATAHICRATLNAAIAPFEAAQRLAPYLWTHQYTHLSPSTCFVLDDGTGRAVGYCIGTPDIPSFVARYDSYVTSVLDPSTEIHRPADIENKVPFFGEDGAVSETALAQLAYNPHLLLLKGNEDMADYKATMHIDLLDEWQGKGWGKQLIDRFVASVKDVPLQDGTKHKGIWIGVAGDNGKVVPFYEKQGFNVIQRPSPSNSFTLVREF